MSQTDMNLNPKRLTLRRQITRGFLATETIIAFLASTGLIISDIVRNVFFNLKPAENSDGVMPYIVYGASVVLLIFAMWFINLVTTAENNDDDPEYRSLTLQEQLKQDVTSRREATKIVALPAFGFSSLGFNLSSFGMLSETRFWPAIAKFAYNVSQVILPILQIIGVISVALLVSFGVYKTLYMAIKWTVWNGYTTDFVGLTIKQNVKRIRRVPGLAEELSLYASPNTVSAIVQANRAEIVKYRKWYEIY